MQKLVLWASQIFNCQNFVSLSRMDGCTKTDAASGILTTRPEKPAHYRQFTAHSDGHIK